MQCQLHGTQKQLWWWIPWKSVRLDFIFRSYLQKLDKWVDHPCIYRFPKLYVPKIFYVLGVYAIYHILWKCLKLLYSIGHIFLWQFVSCWLTLVGFPRIAQNPLKPLVSYQDTDFYLWNNSDAIDLCPSLLQLNKQESDLLIPTETKGRKLSWETKLILPKFWI